MYCLPLTAFWPVTTWNFRLSQISYTIFWGAEGLGMLSMAHSLIFNYNGGIWKGTIQPRLKNCTNFSWYESLPKGYNVQMGNCLTLTWGATSRNGQRQAWWPKCAAAPSLRKIGSPVKIAFWRFLSRWNYTGHVTTTIISTLIICKPGKESMNYL